MAPLRIAVLECDTPLPPIDDRYGGYTGVFTTLLKASAKALNKPEQLDPENDLVISQWDIVNADKYPNLEDIDAVLLTGSSRCCFIPSSLYDAITYYIAISLPNIRVQS